MSSRSRILFLEVLYVVHESLAFGDGGAVFRCMTFVLQVSLVNIRGWKLGDFLSNEVRHSLPA